MKGQYLGEQTLALFPSACLGGDALAFGGPKVLSSVEVFAWLQGIMRLALSFNL